MNSLKKLPRFIHQCMTIGEIPTSYKISLTYEEQLMWFCRFLEEQVIPVVNNNSEVVQELKTFIEEYFENLDVQEEINNKLDEMAEDGTLEEIITEYINLKSLLCYDTVSDMKSATNLVNGSYARTMGYNTINDNGSSLYKIRNITNEDIVDEGSIIALNNENLIAELITIEKVIRPEQFGAVGDGVTNDSVNFTKAFNYAINNNFDFKAEKTYKTSSTLNLTGTYHNIFINSVIYNGSSHFLIIKGALNNIKIGKLVGSYGTSQGAIVLQAENNTVLNSHNKIEFDYIDGFDKAIYLDGETANSYGIQYNEIKGGVINTPTNYGIYLGISSNQSICWINQNYFDKIRTNCIYGIYMDNNKSQNSMNSNIFNEIGLEPDSNVDALYGIYNNNTRDNKFLNCRASEINTNETLIYELSTSASFPNVYEFTQNIPINKISMLTGILKSILCSNDNALVLSNAGAKFFDDGSYLLLDNEWKKTGRIYNAYNSDLDNTRTDRKDVAFDMLYRFGADANGNYKVILNKANIDRSVLKLRIGNLPGGTFTMKVVDANDNILIEEGVINSTGVWTIEKESAEKWYAFK